MAGVTSLALCIGIVFLGHRIGWRCESYALGKIKNPYTEIWDFRGENGWNTNDKNEEEKMSLYDRRLC